MPNRYPVSLRDLSVSVHVPILDITAQVLAKVLFRSICHFHIINEQSLGNVSPLLRKGITLPGKILFIVLRLFIYLEFAGGKCIVSPCLQPEILTKLVCVNNGPIHSLDRKSVVKGKSV